MTLPDYLHVDPKYRLQLRIDALINWGLLIVASLIALWWIPAEWRWIPGLAAILFILILLVMLFFWAPRRYQLTGYAVSELDVHYRTGALWRKQTAVPVNRIQHVEISQGPIERMLGLSRLSLYTAGGAGSDLAIPGLAKSQAAQIRSQLLGLINEPDED
ncbi:PH domain-containing protein [Aliidiomarina soli]|uniref:YdbS-like PH domain-containing protein n=1 Tax=Aliidiomarina soli TaxID=1928574 RepID=A0A432WJC8_9GAMM|nr:PH domain-containing protein [Aliidiomarina soli]RUO33874.1 hypothetical protein CWE14_05295 [Aliidiomarina soli]